MKIRSAESQDFPIFSKLNGEIQALHRQEEPAVFKPVSEVSLTQQKFDPMISKPLNRIYIAESNGEVIGYIYSELWDRSENPFLYSVRMLYVNHLSVRSDHRGNGIGAKLLDYAIQQAKHDGATRIELDVWAFNQKGKSFYSKLGFKTFNEKMFLNC